MKLPAMLSLRFFEAGIPGLVPPNEDPKYPIESCLPNDGLSVSC